MKPGERWSSRLAFILASIGASVGLANIWKFPYTAGSNGGGAFVLVYLLALAFIGVPIIIAEILIGRRGRSGPIQSIAIIARAEGRSPAWSLAAVFGILSVVGALSFYLVVAGWVVHYVIATARGAFEGAGAAAVQGHFAALAGDPLASGAWHAAFAAGTWVVVALGIRRGVERINEVLMPVLFVLLLAMIAYATVQGDVAAALAYLFAFDPAAITGATILYACGQAFFTLGAGSCVMVVYGAYLDAEVSITRSVLQIVLADTAVALTAGLAIFPLVFSHGLDPDQGPGLLFVTLPLVFGALPGGSLFGGLFFVMVAIAAITSAIAIAQPPVAWVETRFGWTRARAAAAVMLLIWVLGIGTVLSFNLWRDFHPLAGLPAVGTMTVFELFELVSINVCLPAGAFAVAVFLGWRVSPRLGETELAGEHPRVIALWRASLRYVVPPAVLAIFVVGFLDLAG